MNNSSFPYSLICQGEMGKPVAVTLVVLNCLSAGAALLGNTIVLTAICQAKVRRNVTNYLIASLAAADLLVGLIMNPVLVAKILLGVWQGDHWLSVTADFMWLQTTTATTLSMCAVSYDRYIAIKSVFHYHRVLTRKRALTMTIVIWVFSFVLASARLILSSNPEHLSKLWIFATFLTVLVPLVFIGYCYVHIYIAARIQTRKIAQNELSRRQAKAALRNKKAACTVAIVVGLFVLLWIPSLAASVAELLIGADSCEARLRIDFAWFWVAFVSFLSSAINPWIYTIRIQEFRTFMRRQYAMRQEQRRSVSGRVVVNPSDSLHRNDS